MGPRQQGQQVHQVQEKLHFLVQEAPLQDMWQCLLQQLHPCQECQHQKQGIQVDHCNIDIQQNVRMCENCESDLDHYNKSLKVKTNLLNANSSTSYMKHSNDSNPFSPQQKIKQKKRADSIDSGDDDLESEGQKDLHGIENMTEEDLRQMEEIKKRATILEHADKGDKENYLNDLNEEEKTERTLSDVKSGFMNSNFKDESINKRLKAFSTYHIQQIVYDMMKQFNIDSKKWGSKLLEFVQTAVEQVRPSSRHLNDSMNFNSFIKIKIINARDHTKSRYVNGVVMSKNIADKRMKKEYENPSILLLKESVGTIRGESSGLTEIQSLVDQEDFWIDIIKQKLTQVRPNIIIVEKDMGFKILDVLRQANITIITNLSHHKMKRVQRYTQTIISPSYNVIDKSFVLGKCKTFRLEAPEAESQAFTMGMGMDFAKNFDTSNNMMSTNRTLLFFEGTNPALGCTILISGNMQTEMEELQTVKKALREMLKLARNVMLEKAFLLQINCTIPKPTFNEQGQLNASDSPFIVTRNIQNRSTLVVSKVIMKKGIAPAFTINSQLTPSVTGAATAGNLNISQNGIPQTMTKMDFNDDSTIQQQALADHVSPHVLQMARAADKEKVNENFVKTKIDSMCGCPKKEKMTFYLKDQDETLGKFLYSMSKMLINNCEQCKEPMYKHFIQYYHKEGCLEIQLEMKPIISSLGTTGGARSQSREPGQVVDRKQRDIVMKGECQHCKRQVTPDMVMSNTFFEYSRARFLEQFFYNGDRLINQNANCNHRSLKDIHRIFIMPGGYQITFTYIPLEVYQIEMIQPKKQDTLHIFKQEIELRKQKMNEFSTQAYGDLKTRLQILLEFMRSEKRSYLKKEVERALDNSSLFLFTQPLKIIKDKLSPPDPMKMKDNGNQTTFEDEITKMLNDFQKPIHEVKTIFEAMFLERKLLLNFLTYSRILEETARIVCLLLALLRLRMIVINKNEQPISSYPDGSQTADHRTESDRFPNQALRNLSSQFERSQTPQLHRRGSNLNDMSTSESTHGPAIAGQSQFSQPVGSLLDDFITNNELRQIQQIQNTPGQGKNQAQPSAKMVTTQMQNAQSVETVKLFVNNQCQALYDKLQKKWGQSTHNSEHIMNQQTFADKVIPNTLQSSNARIEEEDKNNQADNSLLRSSTHQMPSKPQNATSTSNINQMNLLGNEQLNINYNNNYQSMWWKQLNCGFVTMPLGTDNMYIPLNDSNIGSIISFVLSSNIYKEAMIKQNYMDIGSKIKVPSKHARQPFATNLADQSVSQDNLRGSLVGGPPNSTFQTQATQLQQLTTDDAIKLFGKDDVFNYDLSPHQIETELLCGERLFFQVKFSTEKKDLSLRMVKNGTITKLKQTQMVFQTGSVGSVKTMKTQANADASKLKKKEEVFKNDLQEKVCSQMSKDYMDQKNEFFNEMMHMLDTVIKVLNTAYMHQGQLTHMRTGISPLRTLNSHAEDSNLGDYQLIAEPMPHLLNTPSQDLPLGYGNTLNSNASLRESVLNNMKSPPIGGPQTTPNIGLTSMQMSPPMGMNNDMQEFCHVKSPIQAINHPFETLKNELQIQKVDYELKVFFPKKFEALRRFYCGSQNDFIESLIQTQEWTTVSGGKTKSKFYRSFDDKYVFKEIKKNEFKMFLEFAPSYFDYLCKSFFHNYPCALCKILGAYKIKITTYKGNQPKITKKYIYITENLNFGIKQEDERHIIRYDLKGSTLNRFVKKQLGGNDQSRVVLHDNNFQLAFMGRPLPIRYTINRILHICINNDTLCLSKSNIVDYSLLTIIDTKRKKVRFGIIDYVQQYTLDKIFEGHFKRVINRGEVPTIVDPDKYKFRFKRAMKRYFIGMVVQEEKAIQDAMNKQEQADILLQNQLMEADHDSDYDNDELNETVNRTNGNLNETLTQIPHTSAKGGDTTDHENLLTGIHTGSEKDMQTSPALQ